MPGVVRRSDGRLVLRETAQTPPEDAGFAADIDRHRYFNTNSLWFDLEQVAAALATLRQLEAGILHVNQQTAGAEQAAGARGTRKVRTGLVVSDKMDKTVVVAITRRVPHPVYGKMVTRTKRVKAHDQENSAKTGDTVRIMETRPLSKDKRWRVVEIVERAR